MKCRPRPHTPTAQVWDLATGQLVQSVPQKQVSKDHWPAIHWAGDESALAHCVTNTVHLYKRADAFASEREQEQWAHNERKGGLLCKQLG